MGRFARRVDDNHAAIVSALRAVGCAVQSLAAVGKGCPDLVVGRRGQTFLLEVKDGSKPPSARKLTPDEEEWHRVWCGVPVATVKSVVEALAVVGVMT